MLAPPSIAIVIPAYNEEKNIGETLRAMYAFLLTRDAAFEVIVVDDGSTDHTVACVREFQTRHQYLTLVCGDTNHGKGHAVREGMTLARADIVFFMDADGSTPISELSKFLEAHAQGADIVIGSRYLSDSSIAIKQPWYRVVLGRCGNLLIQWILLPGIRDTQCGFKSFTKNTAHRLARLQTIDRWGFDMELLTIGRLLHCRITEIPVAWHDTTNRRSRFRPLKDAHRTFAELFRIKNNLRSGMYRDH